jgi:hypothetical protein
MKLINIFNWVQNLVEAFTFYGSSGGGGSQNSTSYSTNLPEYAKPYYQELLKQTGKQVYDTDAKGNVTGIKAFNPYVGDRIAGFEPGQQAVQQEVAGLQTPGGFGQATSGLGVGQGMGYGAAAQGLNQAFGYDPAAIQEQSINSRTFGGQDASHYMSPYQQNVTDIALREARRQSAMDMSKLTAGSQQRGTFGGARNALMMAEAQRNLGQNIGDIQAKGSQSGYESAISQFNQDQARRQQAMLANQQANLEAQKATQQGQQYKAGLGKDIGLAGLQMGTDASKALAATSAQEQQSNLERLKAQAASAAEPQAMKQKQLDLAYQQEMEARNYQKQQLEYLSNILRGNAGALGSTQTQYNPQPSIASQVGGLGLAGLGLYKALS